MYPCVQFYDDDKNVTVFILLRKHTYFHACDYF